MKSLKSVPVLAAVGISVGAAFVLRQTQEPKTQAAPVVERGIPTFVELGSDKCTSCKAMIPVLEELRGKDACNVNIRFVDVWADPDEGERFDVTIIPTQVLLAPDGTEIARHTGFWSADAIRKAFVSSGYPMGSCGS